MNTKKNIPDEIPGLPSPDAKRAVTTVSAGVVGAAAGVAAGTIAGPVGMLAGGVIGAVAGAAAGISIEEGEELEAREEERLDEEIGVIGGDLGVARTPKSRRVVGSPPSSKIPASFGVPITERRGG